MMREIRIKPVLNGFIVTVGCQQVVFPSVETLVSAFKRYQKDPEKVEKEFTESAINKPIFDAPTVAALFGERH